MFQNILWLMAFTGICIGFYFIADIILNVHAHFKKNRRITREFRDQQQWERFSSQERENR